MTIDKINKALPWVSLLLTLVFLITTRGCNTPEVLQQIVEDKPKAESTTTLEVTQKETSGDPDLIVNQTYTANINGEKITAPVKPKENIGTQIGTTATVTQEIDVTPIVKKLKPNWEVGVGVGYHKELYVPISLQRNYTFKKAIAVELHLDPTKGKTNGIELQHKWFF